MLARFLSLLVVLGLLACVGPEGPQGPMGAPGVIGPHGMQGPEGMAPSVPGADGVRLQRQFKITVAQDGFFWPEYTGIYDKTLSTRCKPRMADRERCMPEIEVTTPRLFLDDECKGEAVIIQNKCLPVKYVSQCAASADSCVERCRAFSVGAEVATAEPVFEGAVGNCKPYVKAAEYKYFRLIPEFDSLFAEFAPVNQN